jgi:hypothetical protein
MEGVGGEVVFVLKKKCAAYWACWKIYEEDEVQEREREREDSWYSLGKGAIERERDELMRDMSCLTRIC